MNMLVHHLMGGYQGNLPHFFRSQKLICLSHGCFSASPNTEAHFLLTLVPYLPSLGGGGTSSIEIAGEAVRPSFKVGVDELLLAVSFFFSLLVILNVFWPILERGSFFFPLIFAYISLLNLLVISAPKKKKNSGIKKKKKKKKKEKKKNDHANQDNSRFLCSLSIA